MDVRMSLLVLYFSILEITWFTLTNYLEVARFLQSDLGPWATAVCTMFFPARGHQ
jgi:hypothetical protein